MFRILLPTLLISIQLLLYFRARNWTKEKFPHRRWVHWVLAGLFIVFNAALLYVMIRRPHPSQYSQLFLYFAAYPFFLWHGATLFIGIALLVSMIVKLPFKLFGKTLRLIRPTRRKIEALQITPQYQRFDASRRQFVRRGMYALTAASFGGSAYGMFVGKSLHEMTETSFFIPSLSPDLDGFTVALISDIHSSMHMMKPEMEQYARIVNSLQCDLILVTGDFVNSQVEEVYPFAEAFSALSAPHGVYGVLGNHDFFTRQPEIVAKEIDSCGVKLLRNDRVTISKNGSSLYLAGVDDVGTPARAQAAISTAMANASLKIPRLLMIHRPYFLQQAADQNVDLVFSGHTHGGQVVLANFGKVVIAPASLASRYVWGKYSIGKTHMYVNRGIGTVGLPIRLNCSPEITKITLRAATQSTSAGAEKLIHPNS